MRGSSRIANIARPVLPHLRVLSPYNGAILFSHGADHLFVGHHSVPCGAALVSASSWWFHSFETAVRSTRAQRSLVNFLQTIFIFLETSEKVSWGVGTLKTTSVGQHDKQPAQIAIRPRQCMPSVLVGHSSRLSLPLASPKTRNEPIDETLLARV